MLSSIDNDIKRGAGIISLIFGIIVLCIIPFYIEYYLIILFLIIALCLIFGNDEVKNFKPLGIITFLLVIFVIYTSVMGISNSSSIVTDLYFSGRLPVIPSVNDIATCTIGYIIMLIYAVYNIVCGGMFFIPTVDDY